MVGASSVGNLLTVGVGSAGVLLTVGAVSGWILLAVGAGSVEILLPVSAGSVGILLLTIGAGSVGAGNFARRYFSYLRMAGERVMLLISDPSYSTTGPRSSSGS